MTRVLHPRFPPRRDPARARSWWGKAWVRAVEEAAYTPEDLARARSLARGGHVGGLTTTPGGVLAAVADGDELWTVDCRLPLLDDVAQQALVEVVAAGSGRVAELLAGRLPLELVEHAEEAGVELLPYGGELETSCTCDPWTDPCPHALAVLSQVAWLVEQDPLVLLQLRGLPREELLYRVRGATPPAAAGEPEGDLDEGVDAALRAARILRLLDEPDAAVDHLF
ncbi:hypothetical protein ACFP3Q_05710 [Nocardioides sp. GCM10027113]|uniref:SWIM zinc finger family protein n=1 Tax=unclassified Nocardioides TaxID=2615069 RepID=UPI003610E196